MRRFALAMLLFASTSPIVNAAEPAAAAKPEAADPAVRKLLDELGYKYRWIPRAISA
jgi:hypothetical protein